MAGLDRLRPRPFFSRKQL
uniref:Uncharacterized protein n=1 Tax=Arundo donax TaxID=35708 RepID=A0A0A9F226_ARUDO